MTKAQQECIGKRYGRLLVLSFNKEETNKHKGGIFYNCICDCGKQCLANKYSILKGEKQSCGCLHREQLVKRNKETALLHGDSRNEYEKLHNSWTAMKNRCLSPTNERYELYGGRGISIFKDWLDWDIFKHWALANGWENGLTIDRIDYNGNYEPINCRWVTMEVQANNTSTNKYLEYHEEVKTLSEWCKILNLNYYRTKARLNTCHMTVEQAFELPKQQLRRKIQRRV